MNLRCLRQIRFLGTSLAIMLLSRRDDVKIAHGGRFVRFGNESGTLGRRRKDVPRPVRSRRVFRAFQIHLYPSALDWRPTAHITGCIRGKMYLLRLLTHLIGAESEIFRASTFCFHVSTTIVDSIE